LSLKFSHVDVQPHITKRTYRGIERTFSFSTNITICSDALTSEILCIIETNDIGCGYSDSGEAIDCFLFGKCLEEK